MAIDTAEKRRGAIATRRLPWFRRFTSPAPDGGVEQADRRQLGFTYNGLGFGTHPRGRDNIGVLQGPGQGGDNFPVILPSADIANLLADAFLAYSDTTGQLALPFRIKYLHGFGADVVTVPITPAHTHDVEIVDANNVVVFNSLIATDFKNELWDTRLRILEWIDPGGQILRIVYHIAWSPEQLVRSYDIYIEPVAAVLDARVVYQLPKRVTSFRIGLSTLKPDSSGDNSNIIFQNGFNTTVVSEDPIVIDGERRKTNIIIGAAPDSGKGRFGAGCSDAVQSPLRRINTIAGTARGNFLIDATGCYRVERPITEVLQADPRQVQVRDHTIRISNDCGPCCDCDDFIAVWEAIRRLRNKYADMIARAQVTRDTYHSNRDRFNTSKTCRENDKLRLVLQRICPGEMGVAVGYCNNSTDCIIGLVIHISFDYLDGTGKCKASNGTDPLGAVTIPTLDQLVCSSVFRRGNVDATLDPPRFVANEFYTLGGTYPHFFAVWDKVDPGTMASVTFRLRFANTTSIDVVEAIADAFTVGNEILVSSFDSPVPGYIPGSGPIGVDPALKLLTCPVQKAASIVPECCDVETSVSIPGG